MLWSDFTTSYAPRTDSNVNEQTIEGTRNQSTRSRTMGMNLFSKLVENVAAICLTHAKNEKWNITQILPINTAPAPALWATGTHEVRRSQANFPGVALSVQDRIVEPSATVIRLRLWCRGLPLREAQQATRGIITHALAFQKCISARAPCYAVSKPSTSDCFCPSPMAHRKQRRQCA